MIRRTKDIVCPDLPEKSEIVLFHGLSDMQKTLYKALLAKNRGQFLFILFSNPLQILFLRNL